MPVSRSRRVPLRRLRHDDRRRIRLCIPLAQRARLRRAAAACDNPGGDLLRGLPMSRFLFGYSAITVALGIVALIKFHDGIGLLLLIIGLYAFHLFIRRERS